MVENAQNIEYNLQLINKESIKEPCLYNVILNNDDYTPMYFVIDVLMCLFDKPYEQAHVIMLEIHHQERGVAGCYSKEVAIAKASKVNKLATANEFPLNCGVKKA